jgi:hypothetical protein
MRLATDKIAHLKAGVLLVPPVLLAYSLGHLLGLHPLTIALLIAGPAVGAAVEWAQRDSNARAAAAGHLPLHDVSGGDLLASAAPCLIAAAAVELLARLQSFVL